MSFKLTYNTDEFLFDEKLGWVDVDLEVEYTDEGDPLDHKVLLYRTDNGEFDVLPIEYNRVLSRLEEKIDRYIEDKSYDAVHDLEFQQSLKSYLRDNESSQCGCERQDD